ncbi:ferredoxin--NADP reductase [Lunatibacter salilacus]|uniref:ferredoxin--NADP reductase n=1 Tax=Lunatibacter salilacus TaxID=2483804 RepID=UPI0018FEB9BD|nr:ferredoxin--NADP reductase [Lunatibacter salilacus]
MLFNLFKKNSEEKEASSQYITLQVREVVRETSDAVTLYFDQPEPHLEYLPGQFLTIILIINGKEERRSYSLCTSPFVDPFPGITVKRLKGGVVSNYINDLVFPGKKITVMRPMGNFTCDYHSKNKRHYGMIVAGSGITPILGITKSILINEPDAKVSLLYGSRNEEQIIFKSVLENLGNQYPGRIQVFHKLSQPSSVWAGTKGRIVASDIQNFGRDLLADSDHESRFFLCSPQEMMEAGKISLAEMGVSKDQIFTENFFIEAKDKSGNEEEGVQQITQEVTITLEGQSYTFDVTPDKTILEAGLDMDIDMPYSCQSGLCTACRGRLLSGKVTMDEDAGLSENEIEAGYILCCSSKPKSGEIKINIE